MKKKSIKTLILLTLAIMASCGPIDKFNANKSIDAIRGRGRITSTTSGCSSFTIVKPPVDFLFLWDNSGSQYFINSQTKTALNNTLNLISDNFDYHVAMAPLIGDYGDSKGLTQVNRDAFLFVANPQDTTSSMPRIPQENAMSRIGQFPPRGSTKEAGLERALSLFKKNISNGVFRRNAYHILVMMSNGDDTSHYSGSSYSNPGLRNLYKNTILPKFNTLRSTTLNSNMMRMISLVPHSPCKSGWKENIFYRWMSNELYGTSDSTDQENRSDPDSYDLCSGNYLSIFDGINKAIHPQRLRHVYNHWLITAKNSFIFATDTEGIIVHKHHEDGSKTLLSKVSSCSGNHSSGYCYAGRMTNINTRQHLLTLDDDGDEVPKDNSAGEPVTGHVIKLFGTDRVTYPECIRIKTKTPIDYYKFIPLKAMPYDGTIVVKINGNEIEEDSEHGWMLIRDNEGQPKYFQGKDIKQSGSLPVLKKDGYMLEMFGDAVYSNNDEVNVTYFPTSAY